jgi:CRP-like cAMP-binding protein
MELDAAARDKQAPGGGGLNSGGLRVGGFSFLKSIPLLQSLSEAQLSKLSASLESRRFAQGDVIIQQGDPGHTFYVIESGEVVVTLAQGGAGEGGRPASPTTLMTLGPGDYFGERALLTDEPRAATCTAAAGVLCQVLDREAFNEALSGVQDLLGDRLQNYEHDLQESSVQALETHVRVFTEAMNHARSAGGDVILGIFDDEGGRRGSTSDTVDALKGKLVLNILENFSPESDMDSMLVQIQSCLHAVFASKVCLLLARAEDEDEGGEAGVDTGGDTGGRKILLDMMQNASDYGELQVAEETLASLCVMTTSPDLKTPGVKRALPSSPAKVLSVPVFRSGEAAATKSTNPIQGVIVLARPVDDLDFTDADVELLAYVAAHVGQVFFEKNGTLNIAQGIGVVADSAACDVKLGVVVNSIKNIPVAKGKAAAEVYVKMDIWHGVEVIAKTWQSISFPARAGGAKGGRTSMDEKRKRCVLSPPLIPPPFSFSHTPPPPPRSLESSSLKIHFNEANSMAADFDGAKGGFGISIRDLPVACRLFVTVHDAKTDRCLGHCILPLFAQDKTLKAARVESVPCLHDSPSGHLRDAKSVGSAGNMTIDFEIGRVDLLGVKAQKSSKMRGSLFGNVPEGEIRYKHMANSRAVVDKSTKDLMSKRRSTSQRATSMRAKRTSMAAEFGQSVKLGATKILPEAVKQVILRDILHDMTDEEKKLVRAPAPPHSPTLPPSIPNSSRAGVDEPAGAHGVPERAPEAAHGGGLRQQERGDGGRELHGGLGDVDEPAGRAAAARHQVRVAQGPRLRRPAAQHDDGRGAVRGHAPARAGAQVRAALRHRAVPLPAAPVPAQPLRVRPHALLDAPVGAPHRRHEAPLPRANRAVRAPPLPPPPPRTNSVFLALTGT